MDSLGLNGGSAEMQKQAIMRQVQQQTALQNAQQLVEKINENCYEKCVTKPGSSLSSTETTCYKSCMDKYTATWDTVRQAYVERLQQHGRGAGF